MMQRMHFENNLVGASRVRRAPAPPASPLAQRGVVLFIALITLVIMTLAAIALVRSVNTGNVIAGNMAFRQGGMQASDLGVEAALAALPGIISGGINTNVTGATFQYFGTRRIEDSAGIPTTIAFGETGAATPIDWSVVPAAMPTTANGYTVRVVIERLCLGANNTVITDVQQFCVADAPPSERGSTFEVTERRFTTGQQIYYRATVQVSGPRNTVNYVQSILKV